jgi:hypothetical protein
MQIIARTWLSVLVLSLSSVACSALVVKDELTSPDGRYVAATASADFGAVSSVTQQVTLRRAGTAYSVFTAEILVITGAAPITLKWNGPLHVAIHCQTCDPERVELQKSNWNDVAIVYPSFGSLFKEEKWLLRRGDG